MKRIAGLLGVALLLCAAVTDASARGYHHHGGGYRGGRVGVYLGVPLAIGAGAYYGYRAPYYYGGYPYGYNYGYYPPTVVQSAPPVYIEQAPAAALPAPAADNAQAAAGSFWYYCAASDAYYPYVKECPAGWQPVAPQPPAR